MTYDHLHPDFRHVMLLSDAERIEFLQQPRWISYADAQHGLDTLQSLFHAPKRPRMPNLLICAESYNGKTTLIRRFQHLCGQGYMDAQAEPVKPLLLAEAPPQAGEKEVYVCLLEQFFTPYRITDPPAKLRYQLIHLCRVCKVRMIIIDEFHSLLEGTSRQQRVVMNTLKLLCNELMIPIVCVGTQKAKQALQIDPQYASRFDVLTLPLWKLDPDFQRLLAGFERILPLKHPSNLGAVELAPLLHTISGGNLGDLHRLLMECVKEAIVRRTERIDLPLLERKRQWQRPSNGIRELPR
ncbi:MULTISPECIES: TniB family NTP-binding protein [unclassified Deinococcus]|uniref:TniB family NTP-binding protein n=1 Tax=unclassified Deinococcus TaxID=2623546 RepID=UPI001E4D58BD|nr:MULTISPECIES: TniB family NTP-binding protein [unclassified Deinococcus]MCD0164797.1 TniB family NTP-binding protein [Deinococcus sp. 12RED42]MCD0168881.1 TniB family NTP-binding protein [Deinococcus sp. 23YEL01]